MDRFLECFTIMQRKSAKKDKNTDKKFKHLETAHNEFFSKVVASSSATNAQLPALEKRLALSEDSNKDLTGKLASLKANHDRQFTIQHSINAENSKKMTSLELNLGHTDKNVLDLASKVKERKIIISRVHESSNEDVTTTTLECINKAINSAIADL